MTRSASVRNDQRASHIRNARRGSVWNGDERLTSATHSLIARLLDQIRDEVRGILQRAVCRRLARRQAESTKDIGNKPDTFV